MFKEILKKAKDERKRELSYEEVCQLLTEYFGFIFDKNSKDPMKLTDAEQKQIKSAIEKDKLPDTARKIMAAKAGIGWSSGAHTALPVLTTAYGKFGERFSGFYENTEISNRLKAILK